MGTNPEPEDPGVEGKRKGRPESCGGELVLDEDEEDLVVAPVVGEEEDIACFTLLIPETDGVASISKRD